MTSLAFLDCDRTQGQQGYGQSMPQQGYGMPYTPQPMQQQPAYSNNPYMQYPQQTSQYSRPQQPQGGYQRKSYQQPQRQVAQQQYQQPAQPIAPVENTPYIKPAQPFSNEMAPREERKLSFASVESTEVSDYSIDDDDLIGSIFSQGANE